MLVKKVKPDENGVFFFPFPITIDYKDNIFITDVIPSDVSSTMIRNKILNNEDVLEFIDKDVLEYIKDNNLYEV